MGYSSLSKLSFYRLSKDKIKTFLRIHMASSKSKSYESKSSDLDSLHGPAYDLGPFRCLSIDGEHTEMKCGGAHIIDSHGEDLKTSKLHLPRSRALLAHQQAGQMLNGRQLIQSVQYELRRPSGQYYNGGAPTYQRVNKNINVKKEL